jgi:(2Fe-2S) ferredoxin
MKIPTHHVFVCTGPHCGEKGSAPLIKEFRHAAEKHGVAERLMVTNMGSVYLCDIGPVVVVYPDDVWYTMVLPADCEEIVREHLVGGRPVERLRLLPTTEAELAREAVYKGLAGKGSMDPAAFEALARTHGFDAGWVEEQLKRKFVARAPKDGLVFATAKVQDRYRVK